MSLHDQIQSAAGEASRNLADILSGVRERNFMGPDGVRYTAVFRALTPDEQSQLTGAGYTVRTSVIASLTRDQFTDVPSDWVGQQMIQLLPYEATFSISAVNTSDPFFIFVTGIGEE